MIRLHGFPISNYHNRIKMVLKIKGLPFEEVRAAPTRDVEYLKINPLGVIPTLEIDGVFLAETHPTLEYLEEKFPDTTRLMPQDPLDRHRVRQIVNYIDIHLDRPIRMMRDFNNRANETRESATGTMPSRSPTGEAAGKTDAPFTTSPTLKALVLQEAAKAVESLNRTVKFTPYIAGNEITLADAAAYCTIPWFAELALRHMGENPLSEFKGFAEYKAFLDQNPDFSEIHATAAKQIRVLERAKKFAGK